MALKTVQVPESMAARFEQAEKVVAEYFGRRRENPEQGTIEIFDERYVMVRGASLSVEFFGVTRDLLGPGREEEADEFSRNILFDVAHAMGKSDAKNFHKKMGLVDPVEKLSAGPVHFAHAGWAFVDISGDSVPGNEEEYYLLYDHPFSFESDAWLRAKKATSFPVCIMNAGYSSGWCEESFGIELVASELLCRARGDDCCRFIMASPKTVERRVAEYLQREPELALRVGDYKIPDFFARKRLDDELRRAHQELELRVEERTEELRLANEQLAREIEEKTALQLQLLQAQKLDALGRLAGGVAHDFNNLLTIINGCSELISSGVGEGTNIGSLAVEIAKAGERASQLTQQLLVFSRQSVVSSEVVDLASVVRGMSDMLARLVGEQWELDVELPEGVGLFINVNASQLEQVVLNLVVNARDAMPDGGTLLLVADATSGDSGELIRLRVQDHGVGMNEEVLEHVFDPFFTTKEPGKGTGLGLSTVYGIVQQAGGSIEAQSSEGEGSLFTLLFPAASDVDSATVQTTNPETEVHMKPVVLLVEDEPSVRSLIARSLKGDGFTVLTAANGREGFEVFQANASRIDVLLTDVVMPTQGGVELAKMVREESPGMRVAFMSGYADDRIDQTELEQADTIFLTKPIKLARLRQRLHQLLAQ